MENGGNVLEAITDIQTRNKIFIENRDRLNVSYQLHSEIEQELLTKLNDLDPINVQQRRVNQAIFLLTSQSIKSFKSVLILALNGYYSTSVVVARNSLETFFNIKFILSDATKSFKRADDFLTKPEKWANEKVFEKAKRTLDTPLYKLYQIFCNFTHSNYMGVSQNFTSDDQLSVSPSEDKIPVIIDFINALNYEQVRFLSSHYELKIDLSDIALSEMSKEHIQFMNQESEVLTFFSDIFKQMGLDDAAVAQILKEYKERDLSRGSVKKKNKKRR